MGLFLQVAILKDCTLAQAETHIQTVSGNANPHTLILNECRLEEQHGDVFVHFNEYCSGYERLAKDLSIESKNAVLLLYIYDDDFWGYEFYDNGTPIDCFQPIPEYFNDKVEDAELQRCSGKPEVIARYFKIPEDTVKHYLVRWTEENMFQAKAYEEDEFRYEDWQMVDFIKKLGYTYEENS